MSNLAPAVVQTKLLHVLHRAFVQARNLALKGDCQQLYDLADTFEILPELMVHWDETTFNRIRAILGEYESGHPQAGFEYLSLLDADDTAFEANGFSTVAGHGEKTGTSK